MTLIFSVLTGTVGNGTVAAGRPMWSYSTNAVSASWPPNRAAKKGAFYPFFALARFWFAVLDDPTLIVLT